jgi:hypothetical protein
MGKKHLQRSKIPKIGICVDCGKKIVTEHKCVHCESKPQKKPSVTPQFWDVCDCLCNLSQNQLS